MKNAVATPRAVSCSVWRNAAWAEASAASAAWTLASVRPPSYSGSEAPRETDPVPVMVVSGAVRPPKVDDVEEEVP